MSKLALLNQHHKDQIKIVRTEFCHNLMAILIEENTDPLLVINYQTFSKHFLESKVMVVAVYDGHPIYLEFDPNLNLVHFYTKSVTRLAYYCSPEYNRMVRMKDSRD